MPLSDMEFHRNIGRASGKII